MIQQTSGGVTCEKTLDTMTLILEKTQMLDVVQSMKVVSTLTFSIRFGSLSKKEPLDNQSKHHPNITACNIRLGGAALLPVTCSWNDLGRQTLSVFNNSILISTIQPYKGRFTPSFLFQVLTGEAFCKASNFFASKLVSKRTSGG